MESLFENLESCDFTSGNYFVFLPFLIMWIVHFGNTDRCHLVCIHQSRKTGVGLSHTRL